MGIMTRLIKICKADVHGVMDQLEDKALLLKQHLRDMQETLTAKETELKKMMTSQKVNDVIEKFKIQKGNPTEENPETEVRLNKFS